MFIFFFQYFENKLTRELLKMRISTSAQPQTRRLNSSGSAWLSPIAQEKQVRFGIDFWENIVYITDGFLRFRIDFQKSKQSWKF